MNTETEKNENTPNGAASELSAGLGGSFAPSVVVDGRTVTPAGWMWVISFALAGCEWAVTEASKPEFRKQVADWMRERKRVEAEQEIAALEQRIANIMASMTHSAPHEGPGAASSRTVPLDAVVGPREEK